MANYYEMLKIAPDASTAEIEQAIDAQYNRWRQLVTHHKEEIAAEAKRNQRELEKMRATLIDPEKRAIYDAAVGIGGSMGGLSDPEAFLKKWTVEAPAPPSSSGKPSAVTEAIQANAWVCEKCQTPNAFKTKFCSKCGQQLGKECPKCGSLTRASDPFCAECGVNFGDYARHLRAEAEEKAHQERMEEESEIKWLTEVTHEISQLSKHRIEATLQVRATFDEAWCGIIECMTTISLLDIGIAHILESEDKQKGWMRFKAPLSSLKPEFYVQQGAGSNRKIMLCAQYSPFEPGVKKIIINRYCQRILAKLPGTILSTKP